MTAQEEQRAAITSNVETAIANFQQITEFEFGLDEQSVQFVDGFINRQRERDGFDVYALGTLPAVLGSFLGEAIIVATDGEWQWNDELESWSVLLANGTQCFPFAKVVKQFGNGPEDSILTFYQVAKSYID